MGANALSIALTLFCFPGSLQTGKLLKEDTYDGVTVLVLEGRHNLRAAGCGSLLA